MVDPPSRLGKWLMRDVEQTECGAVIRARDWIRSATLSLHRSRWPSPEARQARFGLLAGRQLKRTY